VNWVDPWGLFLKGTVLQVGARGEDVALLRDKMIGLGSYDFNNDNLSRYFLDYNYFDEGLQMAVEDYYKRQLADFDARLQVERTYGLTLIPKELKKMNDYANEGKYIVDVYLWDYLGLHKNTTLEEEFWSGTKGNDVIKVTIKNGNDIIIDYFPTMLICGTDLTQSEKTDIANAIKDGFMEWVGNDYEIQGIEDISVSVNYRPTILTTKGEPDTETLAKANILVDMNSGAASMVTTTVLPLGWSRSNTPMMFLNLKGEYSHTTWQNSIKMTAMHEFGHVLGLFDAYENAPLTQSIANEYRAKDADVMLNFARDQYNQIVYGYNIAMVLYAFKNNQLQNFDNGSLYGVKSEIYSRIDTQKPI
jgi:hypothetical protein